MMPPIVAHILLAVEAAALAFLMVAWIRDRRDVNGSSSVRSLQFRKDFGADGR